MTHINNWYFKKNYPLPKNIIKPEWEGKELFEYRREHEVHGVMWITVIASNAKEAGEMIADITK